MRTLEARERLIAAIRSEATKAGYGPKVAERAVALVDTMASEDPWAHIFGAVRGMVNESRLDAARRSP